MDAILLKDKTKRLLPASLQNTVKSCLNLYPPRLLEGRRKALLARLVREQTRGVTASGPFTGLKYVDQAIGSAYCPKLLGTYEMELWPVMETVVQRGYATIVDIGAAEGYYAVGLARTLPSMRMICFEADTGHHHLLRDLAAQNGVDERITLLGYCTAPLLDETLQGVGSSLVICDIEGYEDELIQPELIPALRHTDILLELHERVRPGLAARMRQRFAATHSIEHIRGRARRAEDWPVAVDIARPYRGECMDEERGEDRGFITEWFWMQARSDTQPRP